MGWGKGQVAPLSPALEADSLTSEVHPDEAIGVKLHALHVCGVLNTFLTK